MMYWNGDGNWAVWVAMTASMMIFWVVIAWIAYTSLNQPVTAHVARTPEDILAERFARGDIDDDEYQRRSVALRAARHGEPAASNPS